MKAIVVVDRNWAIGKQGGLLFHLPRDMAFFTLQTRGKTLVMGRATLESLPGGKPLKHRRNIVLTRQAGFLAPGFEVVHSMRELVGLVGEQPGDEVMLIGGGQLYEQLIDCCSAALVTRVDATSQADTFFPDLDRRPGWEQRICAPTQEENGMRFHFCAYVNRVVKPLPADEPE